VGKAWCLTGARGDNYAAHLGVATAQPGDVLVIDADMDCSSAHWGEILTAAAIARGIRGLVITGMVRDVAAIRAANFAVVAIGVSPVGPRHRRVGSLESRIKIGQVEVSTGDWIALDDDGAVAFAAESEAGALAEARARAEREESMLRRVRAGHSTIDLPRSSSTGSITT
jgi:4-hydroxy-4-methyl-2-oxoglutarate aldolase